jgi:hypothetical protein
MKSALIAAVALFPLGTKIARGDDSTALSSMHTTLIAVNKVTREKKPVDPKVRLRPHKSALGISIEKALEGNGIWMNGDAMTVIYELNPTLSELPAGTLTMSIVLPSVANDPLVKSDLKNNFLVMISVDEDAKGNFRKAVKGVQDKVGTLDQATTQLGPTDRRAQMLESANSIARVLAVVKDSLAEDTQPLSRDLILQMAADTQLANQSLASIVSSKNVISEADVSTLLAVQEDLRVKSKNFNESRGPDTLSKRWREVNVHVRVLSLKSQPETRNLEVYYVPKVFEEKAEFAKRFEQLTPNAKRPIPEGNYMFWASSPANGKRVTRPKPGEVRVQDDGSDYRLDLVLEK